MTDMYVDMLIRIFFAIIISIMLGWVIYNRQDRENQNEKYGISEQKYNPYFSNQMLLVMFGTTIFISLGSADMDFIVNCYIESLVDIFLHISIYYVILIIIMPLIKRKISARACATLWMIPNYLYIFVILCNRNSTLDSGDMTIVKPAIVIPLINGFGKTVFIIWLTGFAIVLAWKIAEHIRFRKYILSDAVPVTDPEILGMWDRITSETGIKNYNVEIVVSSKISTPLSIGLWWDTIKLVLPEKKCGNTGEKYSSEELELILTHEVVHMSRGDSSQKFFIVFCTAMNWFNPMVWAAMKKNAEDIELSCDETVLIDADDSIRRNYANLILEVAADQRGFTTCLSASAKSLRNRLTAISKPAKRSSGAATIAVIFFILFMTCGYIHIDIY